jgi:hypothetical protein
MGDVNGDNMGAEQRASSSVPVPLALRPAKRLDARPAGGWFELCPAPSQLRPFAT